MKCHQLLDISLVVPKVELSYTIISRINLMCLWALNRFILLKHVVTK